MIYVGEYYRPSKEHDQMFMCVDGIDYVTKPIHDKEWCNQRYTNIYEHGSNHRKKIIINYMDIKELPSFINDVIYYNGIQQPCSLAIYAMNVINISSLSVVIRDILEHNLQK